MDPLRSAVMVAALCLFAESPDGLAAQATREVQAAVVVTAADPWAATAGPGLAIRVGRRDRLVAWAGAGAADGEFAARGEALYHFLLSPAGTGAGFYLGGGFAGAYAEDWRGWLVGVLGVEAAPGGSGGWFAEAGFGGGLRIAAGFRWRRP